MLPYENSLSFAQKLDSQDTLKSFRDYFFIPQYQNKDVVYLCGNSLGLQPKNTLKALEKELTKWEKFGVEGHFEGDQAWWQFRKPIKPLVASLLGVDGSEVTIMNNLTTNLHLMLVSFYQPQGKRTKILMEAGAFPSDQYALETHLISRGINPQENIVEIAPRSGEHTLKTTDILQTIENIGDELALIMFGGVNYYTGQAFEMDKITQKGHEVGAMVGFDLAHAIGNLPLNLSDWGVDFAVWCSYKYLNSSPGGVSGVFIHKKHHQSNLPRFGGWWGQIEEERFLMKKGFKPIPEADGWQLSNEPILPMAVHQVSLEIFKEAGFDNLVAKSKLLTGYLYYLLTNYAQEYIDVITPSELPHRGCQLSLFAKKDGKKLHQYLMQQGIITDWREPNVIRMAPVPLYNTFEDVYKAVNSVVNFYQS
ncbi:kynureninase [bacterium 336/3]|nr:kynureninase [bacterium 336/3]